MMHCSGPNSPTQVVMAPAVITETRQPLCLFPPPAPASVKPCYGQAPPWMPM